MGRMTSCWLFVLVVMTAGCEEANQPSQMTAAVHQDVAVVDAGVKTPVHSPVPKPQADFEVETGQTFRLTGRVIEKPWTKSSESWNAGGSEYYVLAVDDLTSLPRRRKTASEGVILRPSEAMPFASFKDYVGVHVTCTGFVVDAKPYIPRGHRGGSKGGTPMEQMPIGPNGQTVPRGSGYKVLTIEPAFTQQTQSPLSP